VSAAKLPRSFYNRPTLDVARELLGKVLVHNRRGVTTSGIIVEVEAYIGESDPACHAAPGPTIRNRPLYGPPGYSYVYLNYGIHRLVNVVTERQGFPAAVLIRALEPLDGVTTMQRRRGRRMKGRRRPAPGSLNASELCSGPGNLTMAMGISQTENELDLVGERLFVEDRRAPPARIGWSARVGIRVGTDRLWRAFIEDHPAVSGRP
jgi:DNA-3-methyladenine glycosylase